MHALYCRDHVTQEDLEAFLSPDKARAALASLDLDKDGHISLQDMRDAVLQACPSQRFNLSTMTR